MFKLDSPIMRFLGKLADLILLNVIFLVCCLPVVTIGPALTAMYYVTLKLVKNEESGIFRDFFHSFRQNFRQALLFHLGAVVIAAVLVLDVVSLIFLSDMSGTALMLFLGALVLIGIVYLCVVLYYYPLLSRFDNSTSKLIRWAMVVAVRHIPVTFITLAIVAIPILIAIFKTDIFVCVVIPLLLVIGFSGIACLQSVLFDRVFSWYIPQDESQQ